jgi:ABC-type branched-subunit amino acid transport system substrate-binding protein
MRHRLLPVVSCVVGLGLSVTLTGAFSSVASASTSTAPIVVGGNGDLSVSQGVVQGFEAGIYRFNKAGGLNGRKIKFVGFLDDGFSAQTNLTNAQALVTNDHAMVVAPFQSGIATGATGTYLKQNKTPFIGWFANSAFTAAPTWGYGINGNQLNPEVQGLTVNGILTATGNTKTPGKVKLAVIGVDYASAIAGVHSIAGVAKYLGMKVVYTQSPIPVIGTTNFQPYAQAIISSGANAVYEVTDTSNGVGLAAALKSDNWKGQLGNGTSYLPGALASQPNEAAALDGAFIGSEYPVNQNSTPAVKQEQADLASIGQSTNLLTGTSIGYWSAIFLEQLLRSTLTRVGGNPNLVNGAALAKTVSSGWTYTDPIAGGIGTAYFPAAESIPTGCGTYVRVVGTGYKQISPYTCPGAVNYVTGKMVNQKTGK